MHLQSLCFLLKSSLMLCLFVPNLRLKFEFTLSKTWNDTNLLLFFIDACILDLMSGFLFQVRQSLLFFYVFEFAQVKLIFKIAVIKAR